MEKILITGSDGFIAKNLKTRLLSSGNYEVFEFNRQSTKEQLEEIQNQQLRMRLKLLQHK